MNDLYLRNHKIPNDLIISNVKSKALKLSDQH